MKDAVRIDIIQTILLYVLFLSLAITASHTMSSKIEKYFKKYKNELKNEIDKNNEKDKILFQQSKSAALGELLGIIAHTIVAQHENTSIKAVNVANGARFTIIF